MLLAEQGIIVCASKNSSSNSSRLAVVAIDRVASDHDQTNRQAARAECMGVSACLGVLQYPKVPYELPQG